MPAGLKKIVLPSSAAAAPAKALPLAEPLWFCSAKPDAPAALQSQHHERRDQAHGQTFGHTMVSLVLKLSLEKFFRQDGY